MARPTDAARARLVRFTLSGVAWLSLVGCGRVAPVGGLPVAPMPPATPLEQPALTPLEQPIAPGLNVPAFVGPGGAALPVSTQPGAGTGSSQIGGQTPTAGCDPLNGCNIHALLVVGGIQKAKMGFLWRKLRVKATISNRGAQALDGEAIVRFKKGGQVVQSEYFPFAVLAPGQSKAFEAVSAVAADDVEVTSRAL
ncbi:MAG: hypothetical protein VKP62_07370 [Candidatus Sericytochromatia bacterium]|nr:hypothetical protein [Candidatus Sericytochromatia bacterium]